MSIEVLHPGAHTTVQDLGRPHGRSRGLPQGGAADTLALRVANLLVGNDENAAGLECRLVGPKLRFQQDVLISICGALPANISGWKPLAIRPGETLDLAHLHGGVYACLAVSGGFDVPIVLGSRSTDIRVGMGGVKGRTLLKGDLLSTKREPKRHVSDHWRVHFSPWYESSPIRVIRGSEWDEFSPSITRGQFQVSSQSDRMGIRLTHSPLGRRSEIELPSGPVTPGTIQVPPDGNPIVLLCDAQTLGGYPKIAHVISVDLPRLAQARPGSTVQFAEVLLEEAHELQRIRNRELAMLRLAVRENLR